MDHYIASIADQRTIAPHHAPIPQSPHHSQFSILNSNFSISRAELREQLMGDREKPSSTDC